MPDSIPAGTDYVIKISDGTDINFSGRFTIVSTFASTTSITNATIESTSTGMTSTSAIESLPQPSSISSIASSDQTTSPIDGAQSMSPTGFSSVGSSFLSGILSASGTGSSSPTVTVVVEKNSNVGPIVGGVLGGILVISLVIVGIYWIHRQGRKSGLAEAEQIRNQATKASTAEVMASGNVEGEQASGEPAAETGPPPSSALRYFDGDRLGTAKE